MDFETARDRAIESFEAEYGSARGAPVCVVMPALNEASSVADAVSSVPVSVCGLATEILLVDDGSTDGTGDRARAAGALVCRLESNLGQGRAFQIGYQLARARGARYIATMDADGQSDGTDLDRLVRPLFDGVADFVNGSRRLGKAETSDRMRRSGVVFFAWVISTLTGTRITDPANPLRAFQSELVAVIPLTQPQYQSAELLIGAISHGARVVEVPVTVHRRAAGVSKKGRNLSYGLRFAGVVATSWWAGRRR